MNKQFVPRIIPNKKIFGMPLFATAIDGKWMCPNCRSNQMWDGKRETGCGWCHEDVTVTGEMPEEVEE